MTKQEGYPPRSELTLEQSLALAKKKAAALLAEFRRTVKS